MGFCGSCLRPTSQEILKISTCKMSLNSSRVKYLHFLVKWIALGHCCILHYTQSEIWHENCLLTKWLHVNTCTMLTYNCWDPQEHIQMKLNKQFKDFIHKIQHTIFQARLLDDYLMQSLNMKYCWLLITNEENLIGIQQKLLHFHARKCYLKFVICSPSIPWLCHNVLEITRFASDNSLVPALTSH